MITSGQEYQITQARRDEFRAALARLDTAPADNAGAQLQRAAVASQIETFARDISMWEAGIREPVPGMPAPADLDLPPDVDVRRGVVALRRAEIATIDHQIGILLDRIADWRRHRAWLEREIADLEAEQPACEPATASS